MSGDRPDRRGAGHAVSRTVQLWLVRPPATRTSRWASGRNRSRSSPCSLG